MSNIRGRFTKSVAEAVKRYTSSLDLDWNLAEFDIRGSIIHAKMLGKQGIISQAESKRIISALELISEEINKGKFVPSPELEDVHMNIEARLVGKIGEVGKKLHTARSRNDQVATDTRLFLLGANVVVMEWILDLQETLVNVAAKHTHTIMPGYTHLQRAQPVLFAHHLMAYYEMLERDYDNFLNAINTTDVLPLGSGALAGVAYNIDRDFVAEQLEFSMPSRNSIDAVSDRDYILEFQFASSLLMMHISRLSEELIMWSSSEFDFIELDDAYTTGSSIMPQKKNPDVAELARGKTGRVYGNLMSLLTLMKGLPLAYNRDLQEDKFGLFDTVGIVLSTLEVYNGMIETMRVKQDKMLAATQQGYLLATDIADYLVKKGEPFRSAHEKTGKLVLSAIKQGKALNELTLQEYKQISHLFEKDVLDISVESSVAARNHTGGTAHTQVEMQIAAAKRSIADARKDE